MHARASPAREMMAMMGLIWFHGEIIDMRTLDKMVARTGDPRTADI
jgi:hypothetical protein